MIEVKLYKVVIGCMLGVWLAYPYLVGTITTRIVGSQVQELCGGKKVVVLSYSNQNQSGELYCLDSDARNNEKVLFTKKSSGFKEVTRTVIGKGFYWPFWL